MVKGYDIAGIRVRADAAPTENWLPFECGNGQEFDVRVTEAEAAIDDSQAAVLSVHEELVVCRLSDGGWLFQSPPHLAPAQATLSADRREIRYFLPPSDNPMQQMKLNHMLRTAFECLFSPNGVVSMHAACVTLGDEAFAFTGHSGLGKSTRARAWIEALGAAWMSGDRPAVRVGRRETLACGVPWDGKEQIFTYAHKRLRCIMEVRRSPVNYLRKLSEEQARQLIARQSFVPMWDTDAAVAAMVNTRRLVRQTPVYRVFCGPEPEDARAIYDVLVNHPELIREEAKDMKIKDGFVLRNVVDEYIVMPTGDNIAKFEGAVVLNEISAFVFEQLKNPVSRDDVLTAVLEEYDVDADTAAADLDALLEQFDAMGLLEK